jgi:hypothetical protein
MINQSYAFHGPRGSAAAIDDSLAAVVKAETRGPFIDDVAETLKL